MNPLHDPASTARRPPLLPLARAWLLAPAVALLVGCGSPPKAPRGAAADGPGDMSPAELMRLPDAQPRPEPIRPGGANKPYEVMGERFVPTLVDAPLVQTGLASWYGRKFHGRRTANGEVFDMHAMTAAHRTMPLPSYARVRNPANGREVVVRINDRGPFIAGRIIDLSYAAAVKLGISSGVARVEVRRLTEQEIRRGDGRVVPALPAPPPAWPDSAPPAIPAAPAGSEPAAPPLPDDPIGELSLRLGRP